MTATRPWRVSRWTKHGHDRAYVTDPTGVQVGYVDLRNGTVHSHDRDTADPLWAAVTRWAAHDGAPLPPRGSVVITTARTRATGDLTGRAAGTAVTDAAAATRRRGLAGVWDRVTGRDPGSTWAAGAVGERATASRLARLEPVWRTVHSVPIGSHGADIDHVTVGPGGVLTINSKNHGSGTVKVSTASVLVNGRRTDYIDAARFEADRASHLLSDAVGGHVPVRPLICVVAAQVHVTAAPRGVFVVPADQVDAWLRRLPPALTGDQVQRVYAAMTDARTWRART